MPEGEEDDERDTMLAEGDDDPAVFAIGTKDLTVSNLIYMEWKRRQFQGFKAVEVLSTVPDPRSKMLHGFSNVEQEVVWELVVTEAPKKANADSQGTLSESQRRPSSMERPESMIIDSHTLAA